MSNLHHFFPWSWSSTHLSASSVFDSMSLMTQTFCCWIYTVLQWWAVLMSQWPVQIRKKGKRNSKKKPILFLFCNEWFPHYALRLLVMMTLLKLLRHKTRTSLRLRVFHLFISDFRENNWRNQGQSKVSSETCSIITLKPTIKRTHVKQLHTQAQSLHHCFEVCRDWSSDLFQALWLPCFIVKRQDKCEGLITRIGLEINT